MLQHKKFYSLSLYNLFFLIFVICFGAYVRMTGSGAGCGSHWPLCNGAIIPREPTLTTLIEFSHRISSGLLLLLCFALCYFSFRIYPKKSIIRKISFSYLIFLIVEALLGAFLVLFKHVALNQSIYRGLSVSLHLINTFFLITIAGTLVFFAKEKNIIFKKISSLTKIFLISGFLSFLIIGVSGAITALGDTLFPITSIKEALLRSQDPVEHLFVKLRIYHPLLAILLSAFIIFICYFIGLEETKKTKTLSSITIFFILLQIFCGYLNIYFHAPNYLQIAHLLLAQITWLSYSFFFSSLFLKSNKN